MRARQTAALALLLAPMIGAMTGAQIRSQEIDRREEARLALQRLSPRIGIFGGTAWTLHTGGFAGLPEAPSCMSCDSALFTSGSGRGFFGGALLFEIPFDPTWRLQIRGGYYPMGGHLETRASIGPIAPPSGDTVQGIALYSLDADLDLVGGSITVGYRPFQLPFTLRFGPEMGLFTAHTARQQEELADPAGGAFVGPSGERSETRNPYDGDIAATGFQVAGVIGADYELALNRRETILLVPEVSASVPITTVRPDLDWRTIQVRGGLALLYALPVGDVELPEEPLEPPPLAENPIESRVTASVAAFGVRGGKELKEVPITVEEFVATQMRPLLPYLFFDDGSAELPSRYALLDEKQATAFSTLDLRNLGTLDVYHHLLNAIGMRMRERPKTTITLTGTNSARGVENGDLTLSKGRAERVKRYLVDVWGIEEWRIVTAARHLPALPSNVDDPDGIAENRRVEIASSDASLLDPVVTTDTIRVVDPPVLRLKTNARSDGAVASWKLTVRQGTMALKQMSGNGPLPPSIDWNISERTSEIPLLEAPITATLEVHDDRGGVGDARDRIPVSQMTIARKRQEKRGDTVLQRYNLITFDYDRATLSRPSQRIVEEIRARVPDSSLVTITGYTDRMGEAEHNLTLSRQRALTTARALGVGASRATGVGESVELFDNELPEGRFYSRTVDVMVKTAVKE